MLAGVEPLYYLQVGKCYTYRPTYLNIFTLIFSGSWCLNIYMMESSIHEYCLDKDKELLNLISPYSSEFEVPLP